MMTKTIFNLREEQLSALRTLSQLRGVSVSEILRRAIDMYLPTIQSVRELGLEDPARNQKLKRTSTNE